MKETDFYHHVMEHPLPLFIVSAILITIVALFAVSGL
jgi:hypothetical protein